jgi:hypothetical protein
MACRIAAVMTTIHVPTALRIWRDIGPEVDFIVVGDLKTPPEAGQLCAELGVRYLDPNMQSDLGYKCEPFIGWNNIQRRNIGILEALKLKPDILFQFDDDNKPERNTYFEMLADAMQPDLEVDLVESDNGWFNIGSQADEPYYYRGYPYSLRQGKPSRYDLGFGSVQVGIFNSLILGDPDINATERLDHSPEVGRYYRYPLSPASGVWSPIDTQATAYSKGCAPLAFVLPKVGRYDDIWAGYIAQYIMRGLGQSVVYGKPAVTQARHPHNLMNDLRNELMGMEHTERFIQDLSRIAIDGASIPDALDCIATGLEYVDRPYYFPCEFLHAYAEDLREVL